MLDGLNPLLVIPLMDNLSRAVGSSVTRSRELAAALQAVGAQRLGGLRIAAPRVRATLGKLTSRLPSVRLSLEETAIVRAIIALCLRLIAQLLAADDRTRRNAYPSSRQRHVLPHPLFVPVSRSHRTRIGVLLPPSSSAL